MIRSSVERLALRVNDLDQCGCIYHANEADDMLRKAEHKEDANKWKKHNKCAAVVQSLTPENLDSLSDDDLKDSLRIISNVCVLTPKVQIGLLFRRKRFGREGPRRTHLRCFLPLRLEHGGEVDSSPA